MASVSFEGLADLDKMFRELGDVPLEVLSEALQGMQAAGIQAIRTTGEAMGVRDPESNVHILDKLKASKIKQTDDGAVAYVNFSGRRSRGNSSTRNAEIAFVNEYGKLGQPARPFIRQASEQYADQIAAPGEKALGDWQEKVIQGTP